MILTKRDQARFWEKVRRAGDDECWEWTAGKVGTGYGAFRLGEQRDGTRPVVPAHLVAFKLDRGYPAKADVRHTCGNRACCNPRHLVELLKQAEPPKERHPRQKLSPEDIEQLRRLREAGAFQDELATRFGITQQHVSRLVRGIQRAA